MGNAPPSGPYRNNSSNTSTSSAEGSSRTGSQSRSQSQPTPPAHFQNQKEQNQRSKKPRMRSFPGSVLLETTLCGSIDHIEDDTRKSNREQERLWKRVDQFGLCNGENGSFDGTQGEYSMSSSSPPRRRNSISEYSDDSAGEQNSKPVNATSALFARALVSEVTDNPKTMTPVAMADREKKLLKAQQAAKKKAQGGKDGPRPVGAPGGIGQPNLFGSIAHAITGGTGDSNPPPATPSSSVMPPNSLQENRAQQQHPTTSWHQDGTAGQSQGSKYSVTIGLSLSRRHSTVGHPDTVTRQTAFDFNELQDRQYKYVSSTDSSGWRAGGGERGGDQSQLASATEDAETLIDEFGSASLHPHGVPRNTKSRSPTTNNSVSSISQQQFYKVAAPDTVHIPIIQIDADSPQAVDAIISALARGEIFIPHMAVLPESLSVNGISPPDLVVRFGCERNDDVPPDEWPNWCLEFMHNQLYEYFQNMGARWMKRPFSITLARKVRWKTVKHMNRYFAHAERVIDAWREKGPQYLDPQLSYIEGGATPEEVARPHGIYLLRNGVPTNYFAPNFDPPYTTKMTRSLLLNVLGKSYDKKRREWTSEPIPRLVTPATLMAHMCGCTDPNSGGFMANEVTHVGTSLGASHISDQRLVTLDHYQQQENIVAAAGPAAPTVAGIGTPHSSTNASVLTEDYSQGNRNRNKKKKRPKMPTQVPESAPTYKSQASVTSSTANQIKAPIEHHHRQGPDSNYSPPPTQEEKKIDDESRRQAPVEAPGKYLSFRSDGHTIQDPPPDSSQPEIGLTSDVGRSTANSGTTIVHNNLVSSSAQILASSSKSSEKGGKQTIHNHTQASQSSSWKKKKMRDRASHDNGTNTVMSPRQMPGLTNSDSGVSAVSLEYSMDSLLLDKETSASMNENQQARSTGSGGGSMMMQFAEAGQSSIQANSSSSSAKGPRKVVEPQVQPRQQRRHQLQPQVVTVSEEEDTLSLQESGSSEIIPTDEELFAVGWAKALDPNSRNYYYFTLDRTKTVWENPLNPDAFVSGESSHISGSAASRQSFRQASR